MLNLRRRVCFVLPSLAGGGAERAAVHIINALDPVMWHRSMYLFHREGPFLEDVEAGVDLHNGASRSRLGRWLELRRYLRKTRPDLVMSFLSFFTVLSAARLAHTRTKVIFNLQTPMTAFLSDEDYAWRRRWRRRVFSAVTRTGYKAADLIVATSRGVMDDLVRSFGVSSDKVRVVPNPVTLDTIREAATEPLPIEHASQWRRPTIVAAGRLADAKNYPLMIEAFALLRQRMPARLFILGRGEREGMIRDLIATHRLSDAVVLCGFQSNPWKYIGRGDVFLLTSRYEGFGNVLIEAMACGTPVVATASSGTKDIVTNGRDGVLVDAHTPAALSSALEHVLRDDGLRAQMSRQARCTAQRFSLDVIAREYDRVLRDALA